MKILDKIILIASTPLILIRYTAATILVGLNIWLFSGVASILEGTLNMPYNQTIVVTLTGSIILLMIAGVEKGYAESGGKMTEIESKRIRIMWILGLGFYAGALLYAVYGAFDVIENNKGIYYYYTFDWWGLATPKKIENVLTYTSLSFTVFKAFGAGGVDYIAGVLIDKEVSRYFNDDVKTKTTDDKGLGGLLADYTQLYNNVKNLPEPVGETPIKQYTDKLSRLKQLKNQIKNIDNLKGKELEKQIKEFDEILERAKNA